MKKKIIVCLDWTPNTNHAGFFVAQLDGLYAKAGLDVELRSADADPEQTLTPARHVASGLANFAVTPSESAISFSTTDHEVPKLVAVAALLQGSASAICTIEGSGIDRPSKLQGKRYASYDGRFEDPIVAQMVSNDGGDGASVKFHALDAHAYADAETMGAGSVVASYLAKGRSDSTWIFPAWEGVLAERAGQRLHCFALEDYGIPCKTARPQSLVFRHLASLIGFAFESVQTATRPSSWPTRACSAARTPRTHAPSSKPRRWGTRRQLATQSLRRRRCARAAIPRLLMPPSWR